MDLKRTVVDKQGNQFLIESLALIVQGQSNKIVPFNEFIDDYEEYIDPKDLEIERLLAIIKDLEKPKVKQSAKRLTQLEKDEVRRLVEAGHEIIDIASTYNISTSSIYYWIKGGNWNFTKHRGLSDGNN